MKLTSKQLRKIVNEEVGRYGNAALANNKPGRPDFGPQHFAEEEPCPKPGCHGMLDGSPGMQVCDVCGWKKAAKKARFAESSLAEETPAGDVERELGGAQSVLHGDQNSTTAGKKLGSAMMGLLGKHTEQLTSFLGKGMDAKAVAKAAAQYIAGRLPDVLVLATEAKRRGKRIVESAFKFEDMSMLAHDADLYQTVGSLYDAILDATGNDVEAEKWLREVVQDAVDSHMDDLKADQRHMRRSPDEDDEYADGVRRRDNF